MEKELAKIGIHNIQDIEVRFIVDKNILGPVIDKYSPPANSDYFPYLDLNAARARFKKQNIAELTEIGTNMIPVIKILSPNSDSRKVTNVSNQFPYNTINTKMYQAQKLVHFLNTIDEATPETPMAGKFKLMVTLANSCQSINVPSSWIDDLIILATITVPYLSPSELQFMWNTITPKCEDGLNNDQLNWLKLIKALSQRNSESIALHSSALFEQGGLLEHTTTTFTVYGSNDGTGTIMKVSACQETLETARCRTISR